jgi:hypothetical protein
VSLDSVYFLQGTLSGDDGEESEDGQDD